MTLQEKMKKIKLQAIKEADLVETLERDFLQIDDFMWAKAVEIEGKEEWAILSLTAKKSFDIDEALIEYQLKEKTRQEKEEKKKKNLSKS